MMKTFIHRSVSIFGLLILAVSAATAQRQSLGNAEWKLTEAYGQRARQTNAMLDFTDDLTRFTGNGGCNRISGPVTISGDRLRFGQIISTRMRCKLAPGSIPETTVLRGLNATRKYSIARGELTLTDNRGSVLMRFERTDRGQGNDGNNGNGQANRLDDQRWVLEQIGNRQTLAAIRGVFINFDSGKRSVGGNTACNVFGGSYTASRKTISMTNLISTMRACIEDGKMQTERELLDGLRRADTFDIRDNRLRLYDNGRLLLTFRGEAK